jgi:hypothetical protein
MFYPFLVADLVSGVQYRLNDARLAELTLAPMPEPWVPYTTIHSAPDPVWSESLANAPQETSAAVVAALEDLILASPDLRMPSISALPEGRAGRHFEALVRLWEVMGDALPEGLAPVRHALNLPEGRFLDPLPVVEGSLDPHAPASMRALHDRLRTEFGAVPAEPAAPRAAPGSRLHALQAGLSACVLHSGLADPSLQVFGLRDVASAADFAAARARTLVEAGYLARDIAVLTAGDTHHLARAFAAQGVPLSGLPLGLSQRDCIGEAALHLLLTKRPPSPAMVMASLAVSPLMPWASQVGRDLAETVMRGDYRGKILDAEPEHKAVWDDMRAAASSLPQLRFLIDRICALLSNGDAVRARMLLPSGDGPLDWEAIIRSVQVLPPGAPEPTRTLEGVSLWFASDSPWRTCRHLIITDFVEGLYPTRPRANALFLDSEIDAIRATTGINLQGRAAGLARSLSLFDEQLRGAAESVTVLIPRRDLAGARLAPAAGLSLISRAVCGIDTPADLVTDLTAMSAQDWPIAYHLRVPADARPQCPPVIEFDGLDLLALRREEDGRSVPQSPSRLETLVVSPLAWLLGELGAEDMSWAAEALDVMTRGTIAHHVFENVFLEDAPLPDPADLPMAVDEMFDQAISRHADFLRSVAWEMERNGLLREILAAALRWRTDLDALGARVVANEIWLRGEAHGIRMHGKADTILELANGDLLVVDHKKSGSSGRRRRMEAGWDLQAGLYRDMLARPESKDGDKMHHLIGKKVGIAYHLMNDGRILTSGLNAGNPARDMGYNVNAVVIEHLRLRLAEVGAGRVVMNTEADEAMFRKKGGFTPYALTDGSPIVRAFLLPAGVETA